MSFDLNNIFTTITANPRREGNYIEVEPCEALKPYIRCFWGSKYSRYSKNENLYDINTTLVIPDICMDIIISADSQRNRIYNNFCGICNSSFDTIERDDFCFGIRFYAWSVVLFSSESMNKVLNCFFDAKEFFPDFSNDLAEEIYLAKTFSERKSIAESYLLKKLNTSRINNDIYNSIYFIIDRKGRVNVSSLSDYCFLSKRQIERKFLENTGVSPKQMIDLIRYQLLWQESLKSNFNVLDCVEKFGYTDQSHLLKNFKKYHGITLSSARTDFLK